MRLIFIYIEKRRGLRITVTKKRDKGDNNDRESAGRHRIKNQEFV